MKNVFILIVIIIIIEATTKKKNLNFKTNQINNKVTLTNNMVLLEKYKN